MAYIILSAYLTCGDIGFCCCSHTCSSESRGAEATPLLMVLPVVSIWLQYLAQPRY